MDTCINLVTYAMQSSEIMQSTNLLYFLKYVKSILVMKMLGQGFSRLLIEIGIVMAAVDLNRPFFFLI